MTLHTLTDGSGKVLDTSKAEEYPDASIPDKHGTSKATLDPYERETLYRTTGGSWIVIRWQKADAPRSAKKPEVVPIDAASAMEWLLENDHQEAAKKYFAKEIDQATL